MSKVNVEATVLVITYNHEEYVEEALTSVLSQKTDFDFEIIISEDCSTDGTREIVQRFASAYPEQIRLFLSERNLNDNTVMRRGFEAARGRFLALLDGDDCWTDDRKLQTQVEFLSLHPEYSGCFHNVSVVYENRPAANHVLYRSSTADSREGLAPKPVLTLSDLAVENLIQTCSAMLRTSLIQALPSWFDELPVGDWPLFILCAEHGDLAYLDQTMSDYRIHDGGYWSSQLAEYRKFAEVEEWVRMYDVFNEHLQLRFTSEIDLGVARFYEQRGVQFYRRSEFELARVCAGRALRRSPMTGWNKRWRSFAVLALMMLPVQLRWGRGKAVV